MTKILFQSWEYAILLVISLGFVTLFSNTTIKKIGILIGSLFFYSYGSGLQTLLFCGVIFLSYFEGIVVEKNKNKVLATFLVVMLLTPLLFYKYIPFLLFEFFAIDLSNNFTLPIGISFYTFQAIGYVIDVYRNNSKAERNFLTFACFISFFPQLVAGPIERSEHLIHQINKFTKPTADDLSVGFRHILLGLTLKLLVAETMAGFVNPIYNNLADKGGLAVLIATFCFGIQIYCDFNGYTQIAIGSARLMGIHLMENFKHPYISVSISEFWRRWHISLTSWFRDYLYIPLGGNRKGRIRTTVNTVFTFLVSGIWHGANWTFALWGLANGVAMAVEKRLNKHKLNCENRICTFLKFIGTYITINLFWVLFRANSIRDAFFAYFLIFKDTVPQILSLNSPNRIFDFFLRDNGWNNDLLLPMLISCVLYIWYEYGGVLRKGLLNCMYSKNWYIRWSVYIILIISTLCFGKTLEQSSFVYFRF